jgi:hypothetical protein
MLLIRLAHLGGEVSIENILSKLSALEKRVKGSAVGSKAHTKTDGGSPIAKGETTVSESSSGYQPEPEEFNENTAYERNEPAEEEARPQEEEARPQLDLWNQFLGEVQKHQMSIFSFLSRGSFCGLENDQMLISFSPELAYNKKHLEQKELKMLLEETLRNITGRRIKINLILEQKVSAPSLRPSAAAPTKAPAPEEDKQAIERALKNPLIQKTLELFNGKIIYSVG